MLGRALVDFDVDKVKPCLAEIGSIQSRSLDLSSMPGWDYEMRRINIDLETVPTRVLDWMVDCETFARMGSILDASFEELESEINCLGMGDFGTVRESRLADVPEGV